MAQTIKTVTNIACIILIVTSFTCCDCYEYVPQIFKYGEYTSNVNVSDKISVGDKITVSLTLPKYFYDSISGDEILIDKNIRVGFKLDEFVVDTGDSSDFFAIPETIFKNFDQYFKLNVIKGQSINVYTFECIEENDEWKVQLEYIAKKKGRFYFSTNFWEINTSEIDLPKGVCSVGDPLFDAKLGIEGDHNKIEQMFQPDSSLVHQYFGFVVE